jgi:uroporphyrinogen III methyltransferase/synthase
VAKAGKVWLVGAGPGDPGLLTLRGKAALEQADALVYDLLANPALLAHAPAGTLRINAGKRAGAHVLTQDQTNALLVKLAKQGKRVVRLKGGDPFVFGRGGEEALALAEAGVEFEVVPGISSGVAAPAYAGIPITHRGLATSAVFVTGQERSGKPLSPKTLKALAQLDATLVFFMATESAGRVAQALIRAGRPASTPAACVQSGTLPRQRVVVSTLKHLAADMKAEGVGAPGLLVIGPVVGLRATLKWFENRPLFGKTYVVTRAREQASKLSQALRDQGAQVMEVPAIQVLPRKLDAAMRGAFKALPKTRWVVFSSANGAQLFMQRLFEAGLDARALSHCKVAAVGQSTAQALQALGLKADLVPDNFDAEHLLAVLKPKVKKGDRILLARAQEGRDVLPKGLKALGCKVADLAVYRTVAVKAEAEALRQALLDGKITGVTFSSSSTVEHFKALFPASQWKAVAAKVRGFCLGPITRAAGAAAGLGMAGEAKQASIQSLVDCMVAADKLD